jgi:hypothetical protein
VVSSLRELLSHFLKLLTDYCTVKAIDGDLKPIAFFPSTTNSARPAALGL